MVGEPAGGSPYGDGDDEGGEVRGLVEHGLNVFRGIPFASPPIGDLRFKPPIPAAPWTAPRDAFTMGASPVQGDANRMNPADSEDCLFLNVSAPAAPGRIPYTAGFTAAATLPGPQATPTSAARSSRIATSSL